SVYFISLSLSPPRPTSFPYTTLFRSPALLIAFRRLLPAALRLAGARRAAALIRDLARDFTRDLAGRLPAAVTCEVTCQVTYQGRSEEHTSELQSRENLVCRLLLEKKK